MMCVQFAGCNHIAVVSMLTMALLCGGLTMGGFQVNHIDLSPNFAGKIIRILHMSRVMRKPTFCICENKDADQLRGNREADQRLCFRYIDSAIPLLSKSEISSP